MTETPREERRPIWCCGCQSEVSARLTDGAEVYQHRPDLASLPFWKCDACGNSVGCHHKTNNRTLPLGCIPTAEIKNARRHIHALLDPIWQSERMPRGKVYSIIAEKLGRKDYHTGEIRSVEEARQVYRIVQDIMRTL